MDKLRLDVNIIIDDTNVCHATITSGTTDDLLHSIDSKTYPIISELANSDHEYSSGAGVVNLGTKSGMRVTHSLESILSGIRFTALKAIATGVDRKNKTSAHKQMCRKLFYLDISQSIVKIEGKEIDPEDYTLSIAELAKGYNQSNLRVQVNSRSSDMKFHYNHFAKDIFKFDGVNPDNPFIPCHLIRKDDKSAKVLFINDQSKL